MSRTYSSTSFDAMIKGGLPTLTGQGSDQFPAFPQKPSIEKLFTVPEVGEYLRVGVRPIYKAIAEGRLIASWIGRSHLISESNLATFLKNQENESSWHQKVKDSADSK